MFRQFPSGWWILPSFLLGSAFWVFLIYALFRALFGPDVTELDETETHLMILMAGHILGAGTSKLF